jgi:hypothetical protein
LGKSPSQNYAIRRNSKSFQVWKINQSVLIAYPESTINALRSGRPREEMMSTKNVEEARIIATRQPLERLLSVALVVPMRGDPKSAECVWGLPVLFWGDPGIGKSDRVEDTALRLGLRCEVLFPSTNQPEDVSGVLIPDGQGGARKVCLLDPVHILNEKKKGVLFLDELTGARPATQGAYLGAVLKRQFGDVKLEPGVRIAAAANDPSVAAGGWDLEPPMANRFVHFEIPKPSPDDWANWLLSEDIPRDMSIQDYEEYVKDNWGHTWARARGLFAGFIKRRGNELLHKLPKEGSSQRGRAWASPRTWHYAARAMATCFALQAVLPDALGVALDFVSACVGPGASGEFATWMREADLPGPLEVLKNGWTIDKNRLDRNYAVYTAMVAFVLQEKTEKQIEYANSAWEILEEAAKNNLKDLIVPSVASMVAKGFTKANKKMGPACFRTLSQMARSKIGEIVLQAMDDKKLEKS